jgi:lactoylglutathione lyase
MVRPIGLNHVALEVGDLDEALDWYGRFLELRLRGRHPSMAWIDLGDQFIALSEGRTQGLDDDRHFGLVVDDKEALRATLQAGGVEVQDTGSLRFRDPWGNNIEVVDYRDVQFAKTPAALRAVGQESIRKSEEAMAEMRAKGLAG